MYEIIFKTKDINIYLLSFVIQCLSGLAFYSIAMSLNINFYLSYALILIPIILLVSAIPLSIGGWGIRESAMIIGLSIAGISKNYALAVSVIYGLLLIISALPGLALWIIDKNYGFKLK